jgi:antitoxin ParD1/3/4
MAFSVIMSASLTIDFPGQLGHFVEQRVRQSGLYDSASEYIRDLVRRDFEHEEQRRWSWLEQELAPGMKAAESDFVALDAASIIGEAKARKSAHGS